jgi:hypothetical protein
MSVSTQLRDEGLRIMCASITEADSCDTLVAPHHDRGTPRLTALYSFPKVL